MEQDWQSLVSFRVNKLSTPGSVAAVKEIAKLLSDRCFWQLARLRAVLHPLERLFDRYEAMHQRDLDDLRAELSGHHAAEAAGLSSEVRTLEAQVAQLTSAVAERDAQISSLRDAFEESQAARRMDAQRLCALLPDGYELVLTDDACFEAGLATRLDAQSRAHRNAVESERARVHRSMYSNNGSTAGMGRLPRGGAPIEGSPPPWSPPHGAPPPGGAPIEAAPVDERAARAEADAAYAALKDHLASPKAIRIWRRGESPRSGGEWSRVFGPASVPALPAGAAQQVTRHGRGRAGLAIS
jgi:Skp family chaperone for outer membrane proteins